MTRQTDDWAVSCESCDPKELETNRTGWSHHYCMQYTCMEYTCSTHAVHRQYTGETTWGHDTAYLLLTCHKTIKVWPTLWYCWHQRMLYQPMCTCTCTCTYMLITDVPCLHMTVRSLAYTCVRHVRNKLLVVF